MSILVVDSNKDRERAITMALSHAGLLVIEGEIDTKDGLVASILKVKIVIIVDASFEIDWKDVRLVENGHNLIIIKSREVDVNLSVLELITLTSISDDSQFLLEIVKKANESVHRHVFPMTNDSHMQAMITIANKAAKCPASIMIEGETGTGKEIVAKYIHYHSAHAKGPFVAINCAAIPSSMIEAVLFGYEKGAFTNAINSYTGKFEQADHGTLFLDEIGEMSTELQSKLLRVLQEQEIERIGGKQIQKIDVRVIAATNQDLQNQMTSGKFRMDLFYRLNVINLKILPLRMRRNDIELLTNYFVQLYCQNLGRKRYPISKNAMSLLQNHNWPGNVRELQNSIYRAVILDEDEVIDLNDISDLVTGNATQIETNSLKNVEAETIVQVLKETNGSRAKAAKKLMISPRTLRYKISKLRATGIVLP